MHASLALPLDCFDQGVLEADGSRTLGTRSRGTRSQG